MVVSNRTFRGTGLSMAIGLCAIPVLSISLASGCDSPRDRARSQALNQASTFRDRLAVMPDEIDNVVARTLAATSGQNPRRPSDFRELQRAATSMRESAVLVGREADRARADAQNYFRQWVRESNQARPADRAAIDEQIAARRSNLDQSIGILEDARRDYTRLSTAVQEIEDRLSASMTDETALAVQPQVQRVVSEALNVRNMIARLEERIDAALATR